jgi:hypothetical protein
MTLAVALILNAGLSVAVLAMLAYVMSLPRKLAPHPPVEEQANTARRRAAAPRASRRPALARS